MLLAQIAVDWTSIFVVSGISAFIAREGLGMLKARGIDLKKQSEQISSLHRTLCGPNAIESNGASKLYIDREHDKKMLEAQVEMLANQKSANLYQKQFNEMVKDLITRP